MLAIERGARVARRLEHAHHLAARRVERVQLAARGEPHLLAVVRHAADILHAGEGTVLAKDLCGMSFHGAILAARHRRRE